MNIEILPENLRLVNRALGIQLSYMKLAIKADPSKLGLVSDVEMLERIMPEWKALAAEAEAPKAAIRHIDNDSPWTEAGR